MVTRGISRGARNLDYQKKKYIIKKWEWIIGYPVSNPFKSKLIPSVIHI